MRSPCHDRRAGSIQEGGTKRGAKKGTKKLTKRQLRAARYGDDEVDSLAERVVDLLKRRSAH
jgi:hypothetical protein